MSKVSGSYHKLSDDSTKMAALVKRFISLYLYHFGRFNVDLKCSYTLDYIATLFWSLIYALHGLAVRALRNTM